MESGSRGSHRASTNLEATDEISTLDVRPTKGSVLLFPQWALATFAVVAWNRLLPWTPQWSAADVGVLSPTECAEAGCKAHSAPTFPWLMQSILLQAVPTMAVSLQLVGSRLSPE